jgi:NAD+ diphosphatase
MIDWNTRNRFCATCGLPTFSTHAGYKRICPGINLAGSSSSDPQQKPGHDCPTRTSVSNISFPRSDPTMIAAVISHDGTRVLLGRQRRWPTGFYSVLAGFLEPGESLEEAVRREVFEEAGVRVGRVVLHSTQPWPYPASLMIGAIASALPGKGEEIHTGHDDELEDARWVSMEEIKETLGRPVVNLGGMKPNGVGGREGKEDGEKGMLLPPHTAIANRLLTAVVEGFGRLDGAANI